MFEIGKRYTFNSLAPEVLGDRHLNALVLGIGSTKIFNVPDLYTTNTQLVSVIENLEIDFNKHEIVAFEIDGERVFWSTNWIDPNTIVETSGFKLDIEIFGCTGNDDIVIANLLKSIGMTNLTITKNEVEI